MVRLNGAETQKFKDFCEILSSYYHFRFHKTLEIIKDNYVPFNPNADVEALVPPSFEQYDGMESSVVYGFENILERANYIRLPEYDIKQSLGQTSLIDLKTEVDFDDFDRVICYYRGDSYKTIMQKKFFFWKKEKKNRYF